MACGSPSFEIVDAADAFLGVLHNLGEKKAESSPRDVGDAWFSEIPVVYVGA